MPQVECAAAAFDILCRMAANSKVYTGWKAVVSSAASHVMLKPDPNDVLGFVVNPPLRQQTVGVQALYTRIQMQL